MTIEDDDEKYLLPQGDDRYKLIGIYLLAVISFLIYILL